MAKFSYKAVNAAGQETSGAKDAKDRFELAEELRKQGYTLTSFKEEKGGGGSFVGKLQMISTVSISEKMIFARNMGVMVGAGVSMVKALEVLSRQTSNKKFKTVLLGLAGEIRKGRPLSEAMAGHPKIFSTLFCSMVRAGEASGKLEESLKLVASQLERDHDLRRKVKGAMMYPAIILIAMLIIGVLMMIYVVPTLTSTLKDLGIELPTSTKLIIAVSDFFASQSIIAVILTFAVLILAIYFVRSTAGKKVVAAIALRTPVISGLVKKMNSARTVRTFGSLIGAGVEVLEALQITQEVIQNKYFKEVLGEAQKNIQKGRPISETFIANDKLYPILVGEMMAVGEETGKLSEMLERLAEFYESEVTAQTKDLSTIIEPILMVFIGAAVGFFAISMFSPLYSSLGNI
ncbi:MAG: type II secretion system F family protein [Patescibacteria group bacterium]